jgi:hypothetical protein
MYFLYFVITCQATLKDFLKKIFSLKELLIVRNPKTKNTTSQISISRNLSKIKSS